MITGCSAPSGSKDSPTPSITPADAAVTAPSADAAPHPDHWQEPNAVPTFETPPGDPSRQQGIRPTYPTESELLACGIDSALPANGDATFAPAFLGPPQEVGTRFASALGLGALGPEESTPPRSASVTHRWTVDGGEVWVWRPAWADAWTLGYELTGTGEAPTRNGTLAALDRILEPLGVPGSQPFMVRWEDGSGWARAIFWQSFAGLPLAGRGMDASVWSWREGSGNLSLSLTPVVLLPEVVQPDLATIAEATAQAWRCLLDGQGHGEDDGYRLLASAADTVRLHEGSLFVESWAAFTNPWADENGCPAAGGFMWTDLTTGLRYQGRNGWSCPG